MRLAIDAMGGDFAPREIVRGAVAARDALPEDEIILVGDEPAIAPALTRIWAMALAVGTRPPVIWSAQSGSH